MASADDAIREEAAKIGVIEYLEKPFSMQKLIQIMKKHTILTV
jgi:response regulator of citrate/malate metabolism